MEIINTRKKNWLYNLEPKPQNMRQIELEKGMKKRNQRPKNQLGKTVNNSNNIKTNKH